LPPQPRFAWIEAAKVAAILLGLMIVGLLGAGIWFVSESLVQLAVWRFSIYVMVLSCIGTSHLLLDLDVMPAWTRRWIPTVVVLAAVGLLLAVGRLEPGPHGMARAARFVHENVTPLCVFIALCAAIAGVCAVWRSDRTPGGWTPTAVAGAVLLVALGIAARERWLGLNLLPEDDSAYLSMCRWVRGHTPTDALFVVPPGEQAFRLVAQRAIVINFKGVPQLAGQLPEWRDRLRAVLAMNNLSDLPQPFDRTLAAIDARYQSLPDGYLADVARRYGARYVLIGRSMTIGTLVHAVGCYCLYDLSDLSPATQSTIEHRTNRS
jgi:hypothetical protein